MPLISQVQAYALRQADMTRAELERAHKHVAECLCDLCIKFNRYHQLRTIIDDWEEAKAKEERNESNPDRQRRQ